MRGCIGTMSPTRESLASKSSPMRSAPGQAIHGFRPISVSELPCLDISVDVLVQARTGDSTTAPISTSMKYGVIVPERSPVGLLLPNLDGVKSVDEQIEIASNKANIGPGRVVSMETLRSRSPSLASRDFGRTNDHKLWYNTIDHPRPGELHMPQYEAIATTTFGSGSYRQTRVATTRF
ncbi:MAG: AMMECR1 domain-containing protein [Bacillus subtilis]|nr:AMMECR1 domain-containing protein [Bacillus subtilis]